MVRITLEWSHTVKETLIGFRIESPILQDLYTSLTELTNVNIQLAKVKLEQAQRSDHESSALNKLLKQANKF